MKKKENKSISIIDRIKKIDFKNKIYYILDEFKHYILYNRQFFSYVILSCISFFLCMMISIGKFYIDAFFFDVALVILLGSFGFLFKIKHQFKNVQIQKE